MYARRHRSNPNYHTSLAWAITRMVVAEVHARKTYRLECEKFPTCSAFHDALARLFIVFGDGDDSIGIDRLAIPALRALGDTRCPRLIDDSLTDNSNANATFAAPTRYGGYHGPRIVHPRWSCDYRNSSDRSMRYKTVLLSAASPFPSQPCSRM